MDTENTEVMGLLQRIIDELSKLTGTLAAGHALSPEPAPELLTAAEAWGFCALSKSSWYKLKSSGRIPAPCRIGGALRWRRDELRDWLREGCPPACRWNWTPKKK